MLSLPEALSLPQALALQQVIQLQQAVKLLEAERLGSLQQKVDLHGTAMGSLQAAVQGGLQGGELQLQRMIEQRVHAHQMALTSQASLQAAEARWGKRTPPAADSPSAAVSPCGSTPKPNAVKPMMMTWKPLITPPKPESPWKAFYRNKAATSALANGGA